MYVEGKVGIQVLSDGTFSQPRLGHAGEVNTADAHARFYEQTYRSKNFAGNTAVAGVAGQQAAALAATCALGLCNPTASGINAIINRLTIGYISGTMGLCTYVWALYTAQGATAAAGTAITPKALNGGAAVSFCTLGTGTSVTAGAPTIMLRGTGISSGAYAGGAACQPLMVDNVDGAIILPPGQALVLFGVGAAGTTEKLNFSLEWEESPI